MKRLLLLSCAIFALACPLFSQDSDGHALVSLWKEYKKADDDDLPRNQLDILTRIKDQARTKRLAWDFYDASQKYVAVSSSLDWKQSSRVKSEMDKEVSSFGSALMSFYHRRQNSVGNLLEFVQKNAAELKTTSNPQFYKKDSSFSSPVYSAVLTAEVSNDYEYALWSLFLREPEKVSSLMAECFEGRYPLQALMEYHRIKERYYSKSSARRKALQTFKEEYGSRAVSLLARQELLLLDFYDLRQTKTSTPAQFQSLRADCIQFNKDKKAFTSGSEKLIADVCTRVDEIITSLDSKEIDSKIDKGRVRLVLRNIPSVKLSVKRDGKTCHEATLSNLAGSYYVRDTIYYDLPLLDDGEYEVNFSGAGEKDKSFYVKNTISAALKRDADSWGIYAADYQSGEPLRKVSLFLENASGKVTDVCEELVLDRNGFTAIPQKFAGNIPTGYTSSYIVAFFTDSNKRYRCSAPVSLPRSYQDGPKVESERAVLLLDRAACNPGDTINFKVVVYEGEGEAMSCKQGVRLEAVLYDTEGNKLESSELVTGEYGSAAGSLCARRTARNGSYVLRIYDGRKERLAQKNIRVDDFVLPTYDLFWDKQEHDYMPGDSIRFSGRVVAYSGHSLSSVKAKYYFRGPGTNISDTFTLDPDGGFSLIFPTSLQRTYSSYTLELRITDGTGETLEFSNAVMVSSSLTLNVELENALRTDCRIPVLEEEPSHNAAYDKVVADNVLKLKYSLPNYPDFELSSVLLRGKEVLMNLECDSEGKCSVDISSLASGIYYLSTTLTIKSEKGLKLSRNVLLRILRLRPGDKALYSDVPDFYASASSEGEIAAFIASARGPLWVVAELYDANNHRLESRIVSLAGKIGQAGSLMKISFPFKKEYTDNVKLYLHSFKDGSYRTWTCSVSRPEPPVAVFPLSVEGLREGMLPATAYTFRIKTAPASECAVSISDKALETVASNRWSPVPRLRSKLTPSVIWSYGCGIDASSYPRRLEYESEGMVLMKAAAAPVGNAVEEMDLAAEPSATSDSGQDDVHVREDFSPAICWQPQLMSDADGTVEVKFSTGDKLSTFVVQIFSHDKTMQTAVLRSEVVVSLPVKVAVVQPRYLYEGDSYVVRMTLSNSLEQKVDGNVSISGPQGVKTSAISVPASGSVNFDCVIDRVEGENLPLLAKFVSSNAEQGSDAVKFTIPVKKAEQEIRESHSAVLLDGMSETAVRDSLMAAMVNVPAEKITEQKIISIIDMVKEALPDKFIPGSENVICQSESLYALTLAQSIDSSAVDGSNRDAMIKIIRDCANDDGGFGWFPGMSSSPIVTSVLLQRFAGLRRRGIAVDELEELWPDAVKYIDAEYFSPSGVRPFWCGGLSMEQYAYTRALYSEVEFSSAGIDKERFKEFKTDIKNYLTPSGRRGMNGNILSKARRLSSLDALLSAGPAGIALAKAWGIRIGTSKALARSLRSDKSSLLQYAVAHKGGGYYYPNAVMPFRGLQESELYAHSMLCDLLGEGDIPEGVRLWIMLQKETQKWEDDPAYIEAIASVMDASEATRNTKVMTLGGCVTKPFAQIAASGNGMKVKRTFFRNGELLHEGDTLHLGDRVRAEYELWSEENRSFVRLTVPRPATFMPVKQLSGYYLGWAVPFNIAGWYDSWSPQGYRSVLQDATQYWFEAFPEESTHITEDFYVSQEGVFQYAVPEIECLYAPHYRANDCGHGAMIVK